MKKYNIILILAVVLIFFFSSTSYAIEDKTILILLDELDFEDIEKIFPGNNIGLGFINLNPRKPYGDESLYFSIGLGRKVGTKSEHYKGLQKDSDGIIKILGFEDMLKDIKKRNNNIKLDMLGEKLNSEGISYIGDGSSAIIAADKNGNIKSGEIEINYNEKWLEEKTDYYIADSNILILSYEINDMNNRIKLLEKYTDKFKDYNIIIIPKNVHTDMRYMLNDSLAPFIYSNRQDNGLITSSSTKRDGVITVEDIYVELLSLNEKESNINIGNRINIIEKEDNLNEAKGIFKKSINLLWLAYMYHGFVYLLQIYIAYHIYKNRKDKLGKINIYNNFIVVNIFITLLMGASHFHINIILYLFLNILMTYLVTEIVSDRGINIIGLFSTLTYGIIVFGIIFFPEIIYNSYIGFNNLFYGARYYGFNNGIMGVLLVTSIISYFFIKDLIPNKFCDNLICLLYFSINIIVLSANYGANTGGFLTSVVLFLVIVFTNLLDKNINIKNILILIGMGVLIFSVNMYFDKISNEQSHAIKFLSRIKNFGISEFIDMFQVKAKALVKLTLLPPFSIVIVSQIFSLKKLMEENKSLPTKESYIIIFISIIGFMINDTGMIFFIYMIHYLIALLLYKNIENSSI